MLGFEASFYICTLWKHFIYKKNYTGFLENIYLQRYINTHAVTGGKSLF